MDEVISTQKAVWLILNQKVGRYYISAKEELAKIRNGQPCRLINDLWIFWRSDESYVVLEID